MLPISLSPNAHGAEGIYSRFGLIFGEIDNCGAG